MAIITKEQFKTYINTPVKNAFTDSIISGSYDELIDVIISDVEDYVIEYCNNDFINIDTNETEYPTGIKRVIIDMIKYNLFNNVDPNVQSKTLGDMSISYKSETMNNEYPESILRSLNKYRKVKF